MRLPLHYMCAFNVSFPDYLTCRAGCGCGSVAGCGCGSVAGWGYGSVQCMCSNATGCGYVRCPSSSFDCPHSDGVLGTTVQSCQVVVSAITCSVDWGPVPTVLSLVFYNIVHFSIGFSGRWPVQFNIILKHSCDGDISWRGGVCWVKSIENCSSY